MYCITDNNGVSSESTKDKEPEVNSDGVKNEVDDDEDDDDDKPLEYTYSWFQEGDDVTVRFDVAEGTTKDDITCVIRPDEIDVSLGSGETLLKGPLFAKVKAGESTWTLEKKWYVHCTCMVGFCVALGKIV